MEHSLLITRFLGVVFVVYGLALLFNGKKFKVVRESVKNCVGLSWVIGVCQLFWGALLIVTQEVWMGWMIITTVAGWAIFLMGVSRLWCCRCPTKCSTDSKSNSTDSCSKGSCGGKACFAIIGLIVLIWGAAMLYYGFFGGDVNNIIGMAHNMGQMSNTAQ